MKRAWTRLIGIFAVWLKTYLPESLHSCIIREKWILPLGVFFEVCLCDLTLVEAEFEEAPPASKPPSPPYQGGKCRELFEEAFVEFESSWLSSEEGKSRLMSCIRTHMFPVICLDIGEIGEIENIRILESWNVRKEIRDDKLSLFLGKVRAEVAFGYSESCRGDVEEYHFIGEVGDRCSDDPWSAADIDYYRLFLWVLPYFSWLKSTKSSRGVNKLTLTLLSLIYSLFSSSFRQCRPLGLPISPVYRRIILIFLKDLTSMTDEGFCFQSRNEDIRRDDEFPTEKSDFSFDIFDRIIRRELRHKSIWYFLLFLSFFATISFSLVQNYRASLLRLGVREWLMYGFKFLSHHSVNTLHIKISKEEERSMFVDHQGEEKWIGRLFPSWFLYLFVELHSLYRRLEELEIFILLP